MKGCMKAGEETDKTGLCEGWGSESILKTDKRTVTSARPQKGERAFSPVIIS